MVSERTVAAVRAAVFLDAPRCLARRKHRLAKVQASWLLKTSQSPSLAKSKSSSSGRLAIIVTYNTSLLYQPGSHFSSWHTHCRSTSPSLPKELQWQHKCELLARSHTVSLVWHMHLYSKKTHSSLLKLLSGAKCALVEPLNSLNPWASCMILSACKFRKCAWCTCIKHRFRLWRWTFLLVVPANFTC